MNPTKPKNKNNYFTLKGVFVTIAQGQLLGYEAKDINGQTFLKFQGIPYAQPPLGKLRFKAPEPPKPWNGILDATREKEGCYARHFVHRNLMAGSEDCLYLNVFTRNLEALRPVMVWIHGGAYVFGNGKEDLYGPELLITEDVVLVTFHYRLGFFGFLSFEDPDLEIPGNAGLKDMVMVLQWVQNNISHFGGDPSNVTIFGESAGGTSVHLLMLSKMSKNLYHKAIAQSGSALNTWVVGKRPTSSLKKELNLQNEKEIYEVLMQLSTEELFRVQKKVDKLHFSVGNKLRNIGYIVETHPKLEKFLSEDPLLSLRNGNFHQVPFMTGHTIYESFLYDSQKNVDPKKLLCYQERLPYFLGFPYDSKESEAIAKELRTVYLSLDRNFVSTDLEFLFAMYATTFYHLAKSKKPTFFYRISANTNLNFVTMTTDLKIPGSVHTDEIGYLFKTYATPKIAPGSREDLTWRRFVRLWGNFAKFSNPTPKPDCLLNVVWKPVKSKQIQFLDIGDELVFSSKPKELDRIFKLQQIFDKYRRRSNL